VRREIRLAGFGGQGIILAGHILGKAAALYDNKDAVLSQSYGPEARGGACAAEVVISDEPVDYPLFDKADIVVVMSLEASTKYGPTVKDGGTVLVDSDLARSNAEGPNIHSAPFTRTAEGLGNRMAANVVLRGVPKGASFEQAEKAFQKAIALEPEYLNHRLEYGRLLRDRGRKAEAKQELEKAVSLPPTSGALDARYQAEAKELLAKTK